MIVIARPAPFDGRGRTDREDGRVISFPTPPGSLLSLPSPDPLCKFELSDLWIADKVRFFPAALSRERREITAAPPPPPLPRAQKTNIRLSVSGSGGAAAAGEGGSCF